MKTAWMKKWMFLVLSGLPLCALPLEQQISVTLLSELKKVIPIYYQHSDLWVSNIKLPAIVISNHSAQQAQVGMIIIVGKSAGKEVVRNTVDQDAVGREMARFGKELNQLIADPQKKYLLNTRYGRVRIPDQAFKEGQLLLPGEIAALNLFGLLNFQFCGKEKLDEVALQVEMHLDGTKQTVDYQVPLTPYQCLGKYSFPIWEPAPSAVSRSDSSTGGRIPRNSPLIYWI